MAGSKDPAKEDRMVTTTCSWDCGSRCLLKVRVSGGRIDRIETDDRPMPNLKACARGLAQKEVVYAPDRLLHPLRRAGERGDGTFLPISWDEALETISGHLRRVKEEHGPESILLVDYAGSMGHLHGTSGLAGRRFFSLFGGCTGVTGNISQGAGVFSSMATFGTTFTGNSRDNFLHSRLIILWGWNPLVTRFGPDTVHYLARAKEAGARIVSVDPRVSPTVKALAEEWIPIRPGTDTALLIAMAHVIIAEDLHDRRFLEMFTVGFDKFKRYVLGDEDGIPKTPEWAEGITRVPGEVAAKLARDYARLKPAALCAGWAPGRTAFGEQYHRAASTLAAMTGNIGIKGGHVSGGSDRMPFGVLEKSLPAPEAGFSLVHMSELYDALLKGREGGYPGDFKLLYIVGCNPLNSFLNLNKGLSALRVPEFIVAHELFLTPTARHADIILPVAHFFEREDISVSWAMRCPYLIYMNKVIEPRGESRTDLAIFKELAERLGLSGYSDKTEEEWLREFLEATPGMPDCETWKKNVFEVGHERPWIAFQKEIEDPLHHPFPTPSGRIEIESRNLADLKNPGLPSLPRYIEPWEGPQDPLVRQYPLQLVSPHARGRVNSMFDNIPELRRLSDQKVWLNAEDARERGIRNGDKVRLFNGRGCLVAEALVTDGIMRGVASLEAGAWYDPDGRGVDRGGSVNVLTRDEKSPGGGFPFNSCLVQVELDRVP
jgi:anaerobic dimethyl sulfoxide reductase subunit A